MLKESTFITFVSDNHDNEVEAKYILGLLKEAINNEYNSVDFAKKIAELEFDEAQIAILDTLKLVRSHPQETEWVLDHLSVEDGEIIYSSRKVYPNILNSILRVLVLSEYCLDDDNWTGYLSLVYVHLPDKDDFSSAMIMTVNNEEEDFAYTSSFGDSNYHELFTLASPVLDYFSLTKHLSNVNNKYTTVEKALEALSFAVTDEINVVDENALTSIIGRLIEDGVVEVRFIDGKVYLVYTSLSLTKDDIVYGNGYRQVLSNEPNPIPVEGGVDGLLSND